MSTVSGEEPRGGGAAAGFAVCDLALVGKGESDLVLAGEKSLLAEGIDVEAMLCAVGSRNGLSFEVDGHRGAGARVQLPADVGDHVGGQAPKFSAVTRMRAWRNDG